MTDRDTPEHKNPSQTGNVWEQIPHSGVHHGEMPVFELDEQSLREAIKSGVVHGVHIDEESNDIVVDVPGSLGEVRDPRGTSATRYFVPITEVPTSTEEVEQPDDLTKAIDEFVTDGSATETERPKKWSRARKIGAAVVATAVTAAALIALAVNKDDTVNAVPGTVPSASAPVTPGLEPTAAESTFQLPPASTETPSPAPTESTSTQETDDVSEIVTELDEENVAKFNREDRTDRLTWYSAMEDMTINKYPNLATAHIDVTYADGETGNLSPDDNLYEFASLEHADDDNTAAEILLQHALTLTVAYDGLPLKSGDFTDGFEDDSAIKALSGAFSSVDDGKTRDAAVQLYAQEANMLKKNTTGNPIMFPVSAYSEVVDGENYTVEDAESGSEVTARDIEYTQETADGNETYRTTFIFVEYTGHDGKTHGKWLVHYTDQLA